MDVLQNVWQVAGALGGTVGLILVLAFFAKRMQHTVNTRGKGLSVIESVHLGTKERLILVQVGDQQVLVGVTAQQMTKLATLDGIAPDANPTDEQVSVTDDDPAATRSSLVKDQSESQPQTPEMNLSAS